MPLSRHWLFIASGVVLVAMSILNAKDAFLSALLHVEETALPSPRETKEENPPQASNISRSTSGRRVLFYDTTMITGSINPLRGGTCLLAKNFLSIAGNPAPATGMIASGIERYQSFPMPQCLAWCTLVKRYYDWHSSPEVESAGNKEELIDQICRGEKPLPSIVSEKITTELWPSHWFPINGWSFNQWCSKTGHPAFEERIFLHQSPERGRAATTNAAKMKKKWVPHHLNGSFFFHISNVTMVDGVFFVRSIDKVESSAHKKYVKLTYGGHFHYVRGLYPRDVQTTFALYGRSSLRSPGGGAARVVVLPHAAYLPPWDMHFSYHMAGDVILPLLQALRHRVMNLHCSDPTKLPLHDPTHLLVYRPIRTTFGFEAKSCNTGLQTCLIAGNAGELADLIVFIAGGREYIHQVDPPPHTVGGGGGDGMQNRQFEIGRLYVGNPSNCELSTTTESTIIENVEAVRLSQYGLDCTWTLYWTFRDVIIRMVLQKRFGASSRMSDGLQAAKRIFVRFGLESSKKAAAPLAYAGEPTLQQLYAASKRVVTALPVRDASWDTAPDDSTEGALRGEVYRIVVLNRMGSGGREIINADDVFERLKARYHHHVVCSPEKRSNNCARVEVSFIEIGSLTEAVFHVIPASLFILTHGAAMIYLPLLRPNAGVINLDYVMPTIVPMMPSWIHWEPLIVECIPSRWRKKGRKGNPVGKCDPPYADMKINDVNLKDIFAKINVIMHAQEVEMKKLPQ